MRRPLSIKHNAQEQEDDSLEENLLLTVLLSMCSSSISTVVFSATLSETDALKESFNISLQIVTVVTSNLMANPD